MNGPRDRILKYVRAFINEHGESPSHSEIAEVLGCSKQNVTSLLHRMEAEGLLTLDPERRKFPGRQITLKDAT